MFYAASSSQKSIGKSPTKDTASTSSENVLLNDDVEEASTNYIKL